MSSELPTHRKTTKAMHIMPANCWGFAAGIPAYSCPRADKSSACSSWYPDDIWAYPGSQGLPWHSSRRGQWSTSKDRGLPRGRRCLEWIVLRCPAPLFANLRHLTQGTGLSTSTSRPERFPASHSIFWPASSLPPSWIPTSHSRNEGSCPAATVTLVAAWLRFHALAFYRSWLGQRHGIRT